MYQSMTFKGHKQIEFLQEVCLIKFNNRSNQIIYIDSGKQANEDSFILKPYSTQTLYYPGINNITLFSKYLAEIYIECKQKLKPVINLDIGTTLIKVDFSGISEETTINVKGDDIIVTPNMSFDINHSYHISDGTVFTMCDCPIAFLYLASIGQSHVEILAGR